MNKFINKILKEAEDSSDDFFQDKHITKRQNELEKKKKRILIKLKRGFERIRIAYDNEDWKNEKEKLFLELFSNLHPHDRFYIGSAIMGYDILSNDRNYVFGFYDMIANNFFVNSTLIWVEFEDVFKMSHDDVQLLLSIMIKKYFNIQNVTPYRSS